MAVCSVSSFAQNTLENFLIQPKLGMNLSKFWDTPTSSDIRVGFTFGLEAEMRLNESVGFSAGVLYSQQGDKGTGYIDGIGYAKATEKIDYVNFPILAHFHLYDGIWLNLGFQPGINISSKYQIKVGGESASVSFSSLGVDVNNFDLSLPIGLSYETPGGFTFDARYNFGVTELLDGGDIKNSVFQFTVGYKIRTY